MKPAQMHAQAFWMKTTVKGFLKDVEILLFSSVIEIDAIAYVAKSEDVRYLAEPIFIDCKYIDE
jgi:hypothetical protein